jgi:hypothetical protein
MTFGDYLTGLVFFVVTLGAVCAAATVALRRTYTHLSGAPRALAWALLATFALISAHVLPMALGVLSRGTVVVSALGILVAALLLSPAAKATTPPERRAASEDGTAALVISCLTALGLGVYLLAVLRSQLFVAPTGIDWLTFHLPNVARWIQTGTLWQVDEFVPDLSFGYYPNNGDVVVLSTVLPWHNEFLAHFAMAPYLALTGVAVYARAAAIAAACLLVAVPAVAVPALVTTLVDAVMLASFGAGVLFLVRHFRTGRRSELVLAGLGLGIAFGTKWFGVSSVVVVLAVWSAAALIAGWGPGLLARRGAAVLGLIAGSGGIWLLRNLVESGNPVFPVKVAPFGITIFDAPRDLVREKVGFTLFDYLDQPGIWRHYFFPQYGHFLGIAGIALAVAIPLVALLLLAWRRRPDLPRRGVVVAGVACAALLVTAYMATPYSALGTRDRPLSAGYNTRYAVPALLISAAILAWSAQRVRRAAVPFQLAVAVAVVDGMLIGANPRAQDLAFAVAMLSVAAAAVIGFRRARLEIAKRPSPRLAVVVVALILVAAGGDLVQHRFNENRYRGNDPTVDWLLDHAAGGQSIGLAGDWTVNGISPIYPAFGPRLENHVAYVGHFERGMLRRYGSRTAFLDALRKRRYDYVVVGRGIPPKPRVKQERWAWAAGYRPVVTSERLALYRSPDA